jgi:hypothetical protein
MRPEDEEPDLWGANDPGVPAPVAALVSVAVIAALVVIQLVQG